MRVRFSSGHHRQSRERMEALFSIIATRTRNGHLGSRHCGRYSNGLLTEPFKRSVGHPGSNLVDSSSQSALGEERPWQPRGFEYCERSLAM